MGRFARYEFVQKIAVGGMAEVWSAWAVNADGTMTDVVVKQILPQFAADDAFQNMLLEEAEVTSRLQHPNIVQVLDWGHLDETCFLAMERVVGLDGRQLLDACAMRKVVIPPAVALFAMGEIYKGLDYAHARTDDRARPLGIVHRDVSPSNVLLSVSGDVKLSDFGIARAKSRASHTQAGQVRGKPRYMSPEQAKGEELDGRSDLFAAGLVLHELLTGKPVFPASTYLEEVVALIQKGVPPPSRVNPALPPGIDDLVLDLCERDLEKRFPNGAAAHQAIVDWARDRDMKLHRGAVAELVTSIVRPTQTKKAAEVKGETRIVRIEDAGGVARFATQGKMLNPDLLAPPLAPKASPSGARSRPTNPPKPVIEDDGRADPGLARTTREPVIGGLGTPPTPSQDSAKEAGRKRSRAGSSAGVSAAVATAIAIAIWWVWPRDLVETGVVLDESPVPTLALIDDPSITAPPPMETPVETAEPARTAAAAAATTRRPRASPTATATAKAASAAMATAEPVIAAGRGYLTLRAKPNGEVTIDGTWAGSTPLSKHELTSGVHTVVVNTDDGRQATQEFTIQPDETTTLSLTLKSR